MAKGRYVNTFFWDDPYIEDLCPHGKLLFVYLITTPLTNIAGSFEITLKKMHEHTGIPRDTISDLLKRFEADGKFMYRGNWMLAVNAIEHQSWETHETIRKGIETIVSRSPDWVKHRLCIVYEWLSHLNLNLNSNLDSIPPKAGTADAVAAADTSPVTDKAQDPVERRIWTDGVEILKRNGMNDEQARPFLGRKAQEFGKLKLAEAIGVTLAANPPDPKAYLVGVLQERAVKSDKAGLQVGKHDPTAKPVEPDPPCQWCGKEICLLSHEDERRAAIREENRKQGYPWAIGDQA
jgi:hypothetical protein